jgi:tetratricopeptide (TPR) repeat protein
LLLLLQWLLAFNHVNKSIVGFILSGYTPPALLYRLKYSILIKLESFDGAWPGIEKAIMLYPDYVDLHFYKGIILFGKQMFKEALNAFDYCIELGEDNLKYLILKGVGSFLAWYYKGACYEKMVRIDEAVCAYSKSVELSATFEDAVQALNKLIDERQLALTEGNETRNVENGQ